MTTQEVVEQFEIVAVKRCSMCGDTKPTTAFYASQRGAFGVRGRCRACHCEVTSLYGRAAAVRHAQKVTASVPPFVSLAGEVWLAIVGYDGKYEVSNMGRVRTYHMYGSWDKRNGVPQLRRPGRKNKIGHLFVWLWKDGHHESRSIHELVLTMFVGPRPDGHEGAHLNDTPADNRLTNLAWVTHAENMRQMSERNRSNRGERASWAKLTDESVRDIRRRMQRGEQIKAIARSLDMAYLTVYYAATGRSWAHI